MHFRCPCGMLVNQVQPLTSVALEMVKLQSPVSGASFIPPASYLQTPKVSFGEQRRVNFGERRSKMRRNGSWAEG